MSGLRDNRRVVGAVWGGCVENDQIEEVRRQT